jgi:hypothetical protein
MVLNRNECEAQVKGFSGARYKKFSTQNEADEFLSSKNDPCNKQVTNDQALSDENTSMKKIEFQTMVFIILFLLQKQHNPLGNITNPKKQNLKLLKTSLTTMKVIWN